MEGCFRSEKKGPIKVALYHRRGVTLVYTEGAGPELDGDFVEPFRKDVRYRTL